VLSAACPPQLLFKRPGDAPILDLESLQFETAVEGDPLTGIILGLQSCTGRASNDVLDAFNVFTLVSKGREGVFMM